jgi:hypothetical protein
MEREVARPIAERGFTYDIEYESRGEARDDALFIWKRRLDGQLAAFGYTAELIAEGTQQNLFDRGVTGLLVDGHEHMHVLVFRCRPQ